MRFTALVLVVTLALGAYAEERGPTSPETVEAALAELRRAETLDDVAVGEAGDRTATYASYETLRAKASEEQLVELTDDENVVVRCYAFRALVEREATVDTFEIVKRHLDDRSPVVTFRGCFVRAEPVGDVMVQDLLDKLGTKDRAALAEAVVFGDGKLAHRDVMLRTHPFTKKDAPRLRTLSDAGDGGALVALARIGLEEDVARIARALDVDPQTIIALADPLRAAALRPAPALLPALERFWPSVQKLMPTTSPDRFRNWVTAVAAQEDERSAELLQGFLAGQTPDWARAVRAEIVWDAVNARDWETYTPVFWTLWSEHALIDGDVLRKLHEIDEERAVEQIERDLTTRLDAMPRAALGPLLDTHLWTRGERTAEIVAAALPNADARTASALCRTAADALDESHVNPLFAAYAHENPYVYVAAARALLAYDDAEIDARLAKTRTRPGWGGEWLGRVLDAAPRSWWAGASLIRAR